MNHSVTSYVGKGAGRYPEQRIRTKMVWVGVATRLT